MTKAHKQWGESKKVVFDKEAHKRRGKQVAIQMLLKAVCKSLYKRC